MAIQYSSAPLGCRLHGENIAACGSYPEIAVYFTIYFAREEGSSTVTWWVEDLQDNWLAGYGHPSSGSFGYKFFAYLGVSSGGNSTPLELVLEKDNTQGSSWWNYTYAYNLWDKTITTTSNKATVTLYVKGRDSCQSTYGYCYNVGGYYPIQSFEVDIPSYTTYYTVSYNGNGGSPVPGNQTKSSISALTLSSTVPTNAVTIKYFNNPTVTTTANRAFGNWRCSADSNLYAPGGSYSLNQNCTMTAQWGNATFTPPALPNATLTLTYNYNGGSGTPSSAALARPKLGYNTNSSATTASYVPGTSYNTTTSLNLYPIYGPATVVASNLPVATRQGYAFDGWYKDSACTQKITSNYTITSNTTIYAGWIPLPVHRFLPNGTWSDEGPYVWKCVNGQWQKIAPVYKFSSNNWNNISG